MSELPDFTFNLAPGKEKPSRLKPKAEVAKRSANADRGKKAEAAVQKALSAWMAASTNREANRLIDTRAAGRVVKSAPADFEFFQGPTRTRYGSHFGLLEVKETRHDHRLAVDKVKQLPKLVHRAHCGGLTAVIVYHSTEKVWRAATALYLHDHKEGASWDLSYLPSYPSAEAALRELFPSVFDFAERK